MKISKMKKISLLNFIKSINKLNEDELICEECGSKLLIINDVDPEFDLICYSFCCFQCRHCSNYVFNGDGYIEYEQFYNE